MSAEPTRSADVGAPEINWLGELEDTVQSRPIPYSPPRTQRQENRREAELDSERSVLGAVLIDGPAMADLLEVLTAADFSTPNHIAIFNAMARCYGRGVRPDVVNVASETDGEVNPAILADLVRAVPTSFQVRQYADLVSAASRRRLIATAAGRIYEAARGSASDAELADRLAVLQAMPAISTLVEPSWHSLAEIPDEPPEPLLFGMCEPHGPTLPYAAPGVGKGMTGAYLVREAQQLGMRPAIFDAEQRPREWARRCSGLGVDRAAVAYVTPPDLGKGNAGRPLWESAPALGAILRAAGADFLIVDSILPACAVGEERLRSDASVPFMFVAALDALGLPSVSFGHTPKGSPEGDPFGSFAWVASSRLTWLGTRAEGDGHGVRWRPRKRNERGHLPGLLLKFDYDEAGRLCGVTRADDEEDTRDWVLAALVHGPRSVTDLAEDLLAETEDATPGASDRIKERLSQALRRMGKDGWVVRNGVSGPRVTWSLNVKEGR